MNNVETILRQRALKAAIKLEAPESEEGVEVIYFRIQNEIYAIEADVVTEIHKFTKPTPIPHTPSYICGIFHMRGRFVSLVNLKVFFGIQSINEEATRSILLLSDDNMEFGITVDEVIEQKKILKKEIQTIPAGFDLPRPDLIIGVTQAGVIVLDGKRFLSDSTMLIHQDSATIYKGKNNVK